MTRDSRLYLLHVLDAIKKINIICSRGDISEDFVLYDAVLRNLQTLAESAGHFPSELKLENPQIDWRGITGFRNILVHNYLGNIDSHTVKKIIVGYLPELKKIIIASLEDRA